MSDENDPTIRIVSIPLDAETLGSLRETPNALDRATSHAISAVTHH